MSNNSKSIKCMFCRAEVTVDKKTASVLCNRCIGRLGGAPQYYTPAAVIPKLTKAGVPRKRRGTAVKKVPSGFSRGWHFKIYYKHSDGTVYNRGKLVTDPKVIKQLEKEAK